MITPSPRHILALTLSAGLLLGAVSCTSSDKGGTTTQQATTSVDPASYFKPPLPADLNSIPYLKNDVAALGNVKLQVTKVEDPGAKKGAAGTRAIVITTNVTNGALTKLTLKPETFRAYVATGDSAPAKDDPQVTAALKSGATRVVKLTFDVPKKAPLVFLTFNGLPYNERVYSGLIALDPNYKLPKPSN